MFYSIKSYRWSGTCSSHRFEPCASYTSFCILYPAVDPFHFQSRQLQRLVLHTLVAYAVSGFLSVTDMIASAVYWDV